MTTAIGSNPYSAAGTAYRSQVSGTTTATTVPAAGSATDDTAGPASSSDSVNLSDAAKAYLASQTTDPATVVSDARKWFDDQYKTTGLSSPMLDGGVALDMTSLSRETLSAIAANKDNVFSADEKTAATTTLQKRFDDALMPHVVIARHTGDYAGLYRAAAAYLDKAGAAEQATPLWMATKQAVTNGLNLAQQSPMKAPETSDPNDPVAALLDKTSQVGGTGTATDLASITSDARAKFDALANKARDAGTELVFDSSRKHGQLVDFTSFSNQSLAAVSLDQDGKFSAEESRAAKKELDQRHRTNLMSIFDGSTGASDVQSQSLALLKHYNDMSDLEKAASGYNSGVQQRLIQNYRVASMFSSGSTASGSSGGGMNLASYVG